MKGFTPSIAAGMFGLFFSVGILVQPLAGGGGDRFGSRPMLLIVADISAATLAVLPSINSRNGIVARHSTRSDTAHAIYLVNALSSDMKGSGLGLIRTVHIGPGLSGPVLVGMVADLGISTRPSFYSQ